MRAKAGHRAALIVGLCSSSSALGANDREPIRLTYVAAAGCPSAQAFEASVLERTRRARPAGKSEIAREYRIVVRSVEKKSVARLEFASAGGGTTVREVAAQDCAEAVRAIAIVTALAFDAAAAGAPSSEEPDQPPVEQPPSAIEPGLETGPTPDAGEPPPKTARPATPVKKPIPARKPEPPPERDRSREPAGEGVAQAPPGKTRFELGARATLTSPKAPVVLPGAEVFAVAADRDHSWLLQLGLAGERGGRVESGPGEARFTFLGGRVEGCFLGIAFEPRLVLMPCGVFEAGAVFAEGFIDGQEATHVDPWYALGLNARLSADLGWAKAVLEAGPTFPLRREDRVVFGNVDNPLHVVHDVPDVGAFVSLGLTFELW